MAAVERKGLLLRRATRAGRYAQVRYERGLRAYRRRARWPLIVVASPMFAFWLYAISTRKLDTWSVLAGGFLMAGACLVYVIRNDAPQHVQKWGRGAEGERKTEKALRPLERRGWVVEHDIQRDGRSNIDHVVRGPRGAFLLETKNLAGTVALEDDVLCARQWDDPDEVFRYTSLAPRVRGQAKELSARLRGETGRRTWVEGVVVVWGDFPAGMVSNDDVTYIAGDRLRKWLETGE